MTSQPSGPAPSGTEGSRAPAPGDPSGPIAPSPSRRLLVVAVLVAWAVVGLGILALATTGAVPLELAIAAIGLTLIGDLLVLAVLVRSVERDRR